MKTRWISLFAILTLTILSACSAATPTIIAMEPRKEAYATVAPAATKAAEATRAPAVSATRAPAATAAPSYQEPAPAPTQAIPAPNTGADNYFQDYGVNTPVDTARDHLSTFALDVDTASYTVARRYVSEGSLPPMDAVRAEEFVNAFDQGYDAPRDAAFTLYADGAPSPFVQPDHLLLRFGVQGYPVSDSQRKPLRLTFVIDTSGSMDLESRLGLVKQSLHMLVDRLDERDSVAIVTYGSNARVVLRATNGRDQSLRAQDAPAR